MTQRDLAAKLGKPPSFVGKIEAVERNLSVLECLEWVNALGVEPSAILETAKELHRQQLIQSETTT